MPNSKFLETYPLYKKYRMTIPGLLNENIPTPTITMKCLHESCKEYESRPFKMLNEYHDSPACGMNPEHRLAAIDRPHYVYGPLGTKPNPLHIQLLNSKGAVVLAIYQCASCESFKRIFILRISPDLDYVVKIGQYPEWDISISKELENKLENYTDLYKKGLICESQSYGIGAYSYYRRIVENIIDELLISIEEIIENKDEKNKYKAALEEIKNTRVAEEKIELVKDLLPSSLRPGGHNPLLLLHSLLSEGLHGKTDEQCLQDSQEIRNIIEFLSTQIVQSKNTAAVFTESMEKILDKKSKQSNTENK